MPVPTARQDRETVRNSGKTAFPLMGVKPINAMWNRWFRQRRRAGHRHGITAGTAVPAPVDDGVPAGTMVTTLYDLERGEWARVMAVRGGGQGIRRRLLDMGITTGTTIRVERHAPLGDPMEIVVKDYRLALRLEEARHIEVERIALPPAN